MRDANGLIVQELLSQFNMTDAIGADLITTKIKTTIKTNQLTTGIIYTPPDCVANMTCEYGLQNYFQVVFDFTCIKRVFNRAMME